MLLGDDLIYDPIVADDPDPTPPGSLDDDGFRTDVPPPEWGSEARDERLGRLLKAARDLPPKPGVYLLKDAKGVVLYVGKASKLPDRVSSYFIPSADLGPKKQPMLELLHTFDTLVCEGEWEAVLTETRLIKDIKPRFNSLMTDGKSFPYLVVTRREDFPRVFVTRNPSGVVGSAGETAPEMKGALVLGPFTNSGALREAVQVAQRVFKYRTCKLDIIENDPKNRRFRPCLLYAIDQCSAPCADKVSKESYRTDIDRFVRFLSSKRSSLIGELTEEMKQAASELDYETAAALRDQIHALKKLDERSTTRAGWQPEVEIGYIDPARGPLALQKALGTDREIRCVEGIDIAHLQGGETVGSKVCFIDGKPFKNEYRRFRIKTFTNLPGGRANDDYMSMREVVSRRYREAGAGEELFPDLILIDGGPGQLAAAMEAFDTLDIKPPLVIGLAKKEELIYVTGRDEPIKLGRDNAGLRLCQAVRDEAHRFAQHYHHTLRRKRMLGE